MDLRCARKQAASQLLRDAFDVILVCLEIRYGGNDK